MPLRSLLPVLALSCFGLVVWLSAAGQIALLGRFKASCFSEVTAWRRLVWPVFAGALMVSFLAGWASQEPDPADEWVVIEMYALATLGAGVVVRAFVRAVRSAAAGRRPRAPIATVGLVRCRTVVSTDFARAASPEVLTAALAHEAAHARYGDPLRIWLGQFVADLQWPLPRARHRLRSWLLALEVRRDDEALASGVRATALAEAILLAARLQSPEPCQPTARATGDGFGLAFRVRRLLDDMDAVSAAPGTPFVPAAIWCLVLLALAGALGAVYGDDLLSWLPGVVR